MTVIPLPKRRGQFLAALTIILLCIAIVFINFFASYLYAKQELVPSTSSSTLNFQKITKEYPGFKTIFLARFKQPLNLNRLFKLVDAGAWPVNNGFLATLGKKSAIFHTQATNLAHIGRSGVAQGVVPLTRFKLIGIYQVHFKIVEPDFKGPVSFSVTSPRSGFGKKLIYIEDHVRPDLPINIRRDSAGNRWVDVTLPEAFKNQTIKFGFFFIYQVDVKELLNHALDMVETDQWAELSNSDPARIFLFPSKKINPASKPIQNTELKVIGEIKSPRLAYHRLRKYIKSEISYNYSKKTAFFGGKKVYSAMAEMYRPPEETLQEKLGACPDISLLEAAILRAAGIPTRTAGRWGHFYSEVYLPEHGWMSTSVTPTGIPIVVDPDNKHQPFAKWSPEIAVQTVNWTGQVKIEPES